MPDEIDRKTSTRRISNPDGDGNPSDSDVIVEVIDEITFIDPKQKYQQFTWTLDNSSDSSRAAHAVTLTGSDQTSKISVERPDEYAVIDSKDRYQETRTTLDNAGEGRFAIDYAPPDGDHRVTHDVKIHSKDGSAWLLVRRTDSFRVTSGADEQHWETEFALNNKDADAGDPPPTLAPPTTTWDKTSINPPWRLDPFQNIVDVQWCTLAVVFYDGAG